MFQALHPLNSIFLGQFCLKEAIMTFQNSRGVLGAGTPITKMTNFPMEYGNSKNCLRIVKAGATRTLNKTIKLYKLLFNLSVFFNPPVFAPNTPHPPDNPP